MVYYSVHPMQDVVDRNEWAFTRQVIMQSTGRYKPIKIDDLILAWDVPKKQTQAEISKNLKLVRMALGEKK